MIDQVVEEDKLKDIYPYLENVTVCGNSKIEHNQNVKRFLKSMSKRNLVLNEKKTISFVSGIEILGY